MDTFGYNSPDTVNQIRRGIADTQNARIDALLNQYNLQGKIGADKALANPQTAMALQALSQQNTPATAPFPGQDSSSQSQGGNGIQPMPQIMPVTQDPQISMSQLRQPVGGGSPAPFPPSPSQIPGNPFFNTPQGQDMPQGLPGSEQIPSTQQTQIPQGQQGINPQQIIQQYPTPGAFISAIQQANPNISGAALSNVIQKIMPLYQNKNVGLTPYQQLETQTRMQQLALGKQRNERLQGGLDLATKKAGLGYVADRARANLGGKVSEATSIADTAIEKLLPKAEELYSKLPRSSILALGSVQNFLNTQTNDPNLAELKPILEGIAREYARAMGGTGSVAVANLNHARDLLGTSKNLSAFKAAMDGLKYDIRINKEAAAENVPTGSQKNMPDSSTGINVQGNAPPENLPEGAKQAPDGNYYVPDPDRPGKYLQVVQ